MENTVTIPADEYRRLLIAASHLDIILDAKEVHPELATETVVDIVRSTVRRVEPLELDF